MDKNNTLIHLYIQTSIYIICCSVTLRHVNVGGSDLLPYCLLPISNISLSTRREKRIFMSYIIEYAYTIPYDHLLNHADSYLFESFSFPRKTFHSSSPLYFWPFSFNYLIFSFYLSIYLFVCPSSF